MSLESIITYEKNNGDEISLVSKKVSGYNVYRIIPDRFIESGKVVEEILATVTALKRSFIYIKDKEVIIDINMPIHYEILYEGKKITFNFAIPDKYEDVVVNKIQRVFRTATIKKIEEDYFSQFKDNYVANFSQKNSFVFSLNTDYRENGLIEGLMGVSSNIKDDDKVLLQLSILPLDDRWKQKWDNLYDKVMRGEDVITSKGPISYILDNAFKMTEGILHTADMFMSFDAEEDYRELNRRRGIRGYGGGMSNRGIGHRNMMGRMGMNNYENRRLNVQKRNYDGFRTQIRMFCNNPENTHYYAKIFDGVFKILKADQELYISKIKRNKKNERGMSIDTINHIFSAKEISTLMQLPNRRLQLEFREHLKSIESVEVAIPKELKEKGIPIGYVTYKGEKMLVNWRTHDKHMGPMHKIITGLQRTGKSTYITNFAIEALIQGQSVFIIDTIKDCDVANDVRDYIPDQLQDKLIVLDFSNLDYLLPLDWSESSFKEGGNTRERLKVASFISGNFESFLETVGELKGESSRLSPQMKRYLSSACKLVMSQKGTNIKDILDVLVDVETRHRFIESSGLGVNNTIIQDMRNLDEVDNKTGEITTKLSRVSGIIDRVSILLNDYVMELLLSTKPNEEINFRKWADEGKCVLIKLPDKEFSRSSLKSIVTLLYSKIWLAMIGREGDNHKLTHVILDEVHNFPQVTDMLKINCRETAKYGLSYVFTSHLLKDLKGLLPYIKASGCNFMMFKTTRDNFALLEDDLLQGGFAIDDCMRIKDYHTINIVNYDRDYVVFESKVIDPPDKRFIKKDRSKLDLEHSIKYGNHYEDL